MDEVLVRLREDLVRTLGKNMVCLMHTGSRVRREATDESDYDVFLVLESVNSSVIRELRQVFSKYPDFSAYFVSKQEFETLPRAQLLQLLYSEKLYGEMKYGLPTKGEVENYIALVRREWLDRLRHYLVVPHPKEKLAKHAHLALKYTSLYLSYRIFLETGKLPRTRKEIIAHLRGKESQNLAMRLVRIQDNWQLYREDVARRPDHYLFLLEKFFRKSRP
jgi:predicted nucleotidyltransferase